MITILGCDYHAVRIARPSGGWPGHVFVPRTNATSVSRKVSGMEPAPLSPTSTCVDSRVHQPLAVAARQRFSVPARFTWTAAESALSGLGIDAQRATVAAYAERKGLTIVGEYCGEGLSAKSLKNRPAALAALEAFRSGQAAGLPVAKETVAKERWTGLPLGGERHARLRERARHEGWALHLADLDIDTSTPAGKMAANIIVSGSLYERRLIRQRTRDAVAANRA